MMKILHHHQHHHHRMKATFGDFQMHEEFPFRGAYASAVKRSQSQLFLRDAAFPAAAEDTPTSALKRQLASFFSSASAHFSFPSRIAQRCTWATVSKPTRLRRCRSRGFEGFPRTLAWLPPLRDPLWGTSWSWNCSRTLSFSQSEKQRWSLFLSVGTCSLITIACKLLILGI